MVMSLVTGVPRSGKTLYSVARRLAVVHAR